MTTPLGARMRAEIAEQPAVLAGALARRPEISRVAAAIARRRPRFALLAARGSSDHGAPKTDICVTPDPAR